MKLTQNDKYHKLITSSAGRGNISMSISEKKRGDHVQYIFLNRKQQEKLVFRIQDFWMYNK